MSASGAGGPRVQRLFERASSADSIGEVIFTGIGGILLALGTALASGVLTVADIFIVPANAFIQATGELVSALFGGAADIINLGGIASALSIGPGGLFASPISFVIGIAVVLLGFYVLIAFISEEETTNFFPLIGSGFDLPSPGFIDAEEENDE